MAKMFLDMDETKALLGKSDDEIRQFVKDGRLREFRDGQVAKFKADQVESLKRDMAATGPGEALEVNPADSGIGLADVLDPADSTSGGISLVDSKTGSGSKGASGSTKTGSKAPHPDDDTALAVDLGLSGSATGIPSPASRGGSVAGMSGSQTSQSGIDIFRDDTEKAADPSAQTSVAAGINPEQMNIESAGSGSGLLDLTRESDDTSLGAELLDEIAPGASGTRRAPSESSVTASGIGSGMSAATETPAKLVPVVPVEAPDPLAPAFGLAAAGATAAVLLAAFSLMSGLAGSEPDILVKIGSQSFLVILGLCFALPVILFVAGFLTGRSKKA